MGLSDPVYKGLKNVRWECFHCGVPNFSLSLFDTHIFETSNTSYLDETTESNLSFSNPMATSSPNKTTPTREDLPLRILVLNCQSIKAPGKPAQLATIIESTQADIVIGSESWLDPSISSAEVFPTNFTSFRNDRSSGKSCGGVFLLVSNRYESQEPEELKAGDKCEVVWAKIKVQGSKDLYIGSFYRPPDNHEPEYIGHLERYLSHSQLHRGPISGLGRLQFGRHRLAK